MSLKTWWNRPRPKPLETTSKKNDQHVVTRIHHLFTLPVSPSIDKPRFLPCLCSIPEDCVVKDLLIGEDKHTVTCLGCGRRHTGIMDPTSLPKDLFRTKEWRAQVLHTLARRGSGCADTPQGLLRCDECGSPEQDATARCMQCQIYLCSACQAHHERALVSQSHEVISIMELCQTKGDSLTTMGDRLVCESHGADMVLFCSTCDKLVCNQCALQSCRCHGLTDIDVAGITTREQLGMLSTTLGSHKEVVVEAINQVQTTLTSVKDQHRLAHAQIDEYMEDMCRMITLRAQELHKEADRWLEHQQSSCSQHCKNLMSQVAALDKTRRMTERTTALESHGEVLYLRHLLINRITSLLPGGHDCPSTTPLAPSMRFAPNPLWLINRGSFGMLRMNGEEDSGDMQTKAATGGEGDKSKEEEVVVLKARLEEMDRAYRALQDRLASYQRDEEEEEEEGLEVVSEEEEEGDMPSEVDEGEEQEEGGGSEMMEASGGGGLSYHQEEEEVTGIEGGASQEEEEHVAAAASAPLPAASKSVSYPYHFQRPAVQSQDDDRVYQRDDKILARWRDTNHFFPARILVVNKGKVVTYQVIYDAGGFDARVRKEDIKPRPTPGLSQ